MNRFAAVGLLRDADLGKSTLVVTPRQREARIAIDIVMRTAEQLGVTGVRAFRSNGGERVVLGGAQIRFISAQAQTGAYRGESVNTVLLDEGVDLPMDGRLHQDLLAIICTHPDGEIVRA